MRRPALAPFLGLRPLLGLAAQLLILIAASAVIRTGTTLAGVHVPD